MRAFFLPTARLGLALALVLALSPRVASGQDASRGHPPDGAVLSGFVVDSITGEPIEGVLVRIDSGQELLTDGEGAFRFSDLPEGRRMVALLTADCRITWGEVTVLDRFPRSVEFRLPPVFGASAVEARRARAERERSGGGKRLEAAEIEQLQARSVMELIRRLAPAMVRGAAGQAGSTATITSGRSSSFIGGEAPVVVIDGIRMPDSDASLQNMRPEEVQLLEVLPGAAAGWEYGSSGSGGVIRITLKRGLATGAAERPPVAPCVVPTFPGG